MIHVNTRVLAILVVMSATIGLAACSSEGALPLTQTFRTLGVQLARGNAELRDARSVLTPAMVAATQQPHILVELPSRKASATRSLFHQRGGVQDWRGADGISLILQDDVLIGTRGLGPDLLSADPVPIAALRETDPAPYMRSFRHLDGENRLNITNFRCSLKPGGPDRVDLIARQVTTGRVIETCQRIDQKGAPIVNEYWLGLNDNIVWKSKQWVSESVDYATIFHLVR